MGKLPWQHINMPTAATFVVGCVIGAVFFGRPDCLAGVPGTASDDVIILPALQRPKQADAAERPHPIANSPPPVTVVLAVVEDRFCLPEERRPRWKNDYKLKRMMRRSAAAINLHYAKRHGYIFRMYCQGDSRGFATAWLKVVALEQLFEEASARSGPTYVVLMDSDSFIRQVEVGLPEWIRQQGLNITAEPWSVMYGQESVVGPFKKPQWVNTGVAYGYIDPTDPERLAAGLTALRRWQSSVCDGCSEFQTDDKHPWEQGCLEKLLRVPGPIRDAINVSASHMNAWNGPWGQYIRHVWGGPGKELRKILFSDMVLSHQIDVEHSVKEIETHHLGPNLTFSRPSCEPFPGDRTINKQ